MNRIRNHPKTHRFTAFLLCLSMIVSMFNGIGFGSPFTARAEGGNTANVERVTSGVERQADPSTMDTYKEMLNFDENSRYAGRLWTDKTVFAYGEKYTGSGNDDGRTFTASGNVNTLQLTKALDGVEGSISLDADFLHVFSALGSSQKIDENVPVDLVLSIDITSSMLAHGQKKDDGTEEQDMSPRTYWYANGGNTGDVVLKHDSYWNCNLKHTLNAANELMKNMRTYSDDTRISVVVYWGTGYQMIPFVDGDVEFTGYSIRKDSGGPVEPILHYSIKSSESGNVPDGDYVYDPVSGAHYRYNLGQSPLYDLGSTNNSNMNEESTRIGEYLAFTANNAYDVVAENKLIEIDSEGGQPKSTMPDSPSQLGAGTNVEAGIYTAMQAAASVTDVTYTLSDGTKVNRIPAVVILGDGNTNHLLVKASDSDATRPETGGALGTSPESVTISGEWWNPASPQKSAGAGVVGKGDNGPDHDGANVANFVGALQGAYWKAAIGHNYNMETDDVKVYTIGVGADPAVLNPVDNIGEGQNQIPIDRFDEWKIEPNEPFKIENVGKNPDDPNKYDKTDADPFALARPDGTEYLFNKLEDASEELKKNGVATKDLDLNYPTKYYSTGAAGEGTKSIGEIFESLYTEITRNLFSPIGGANDLGVDNAITYRDPIGKYMEVKDVKNLALFGELYNLKKTAMYNYAFVSSHRTGGDGTFKDGWYHFDADGNWYGDAKGKGDAWKIGLIDPHCYSESLPLINGETPWVKLADGSYWAYFVNSKTAMQFVPTVAVSDTVSQLENNPETKDQAEKLKNTTYTFYRIDDQDLNSLRMNPVYGGNIPEDVEYDAENQLHLKSPGIYALSDLRIWVEDTGDYSDIVGDTISDTNYDEALYINIPVNMLPLRTVTVKQGGDKSGWTYETNLPDDDFQPESAESASFPFRVFYTVGIEEGLLTSDRSIDIAGGVSPEYISQNKAQDWKWAEARGLKENDIEFFSNWYNPENRYGDYVTTGTDYSYGDPVVTFSPSTDNRYYIFQKALPLYNAAYVYNDSEWKKVTIDENGSTNKEEARYTPADFGGRVLADDLEIEGDANSGSIQSALQKKSITPEEGDIVFLKGNMLTNVDKADPDPFSSAGYYYMAINYYTLGKDNNVAVPVQYAVTRKGSEFGSAYKAAGITNGDMLCWYDVSGKNDETYPYLSFTETNDITRGRNYIGKKDIYADDEKTLKSPDDCEPADGFVNEGNWVVATKPGGLRVGALAQAVGEKYGVDEDGNRTVKTFTNYTKEYVESRFPGKQEDLQWGYYNGNATRTANNYYLPTISTSSNVEKNDLVVNVYLGNNGRLWTNSTLLLVTKLLEKSPGVDNLPENSSGKKFDFQATVAGLSGEVDAVRVRYNEAQGAWQRQLHYIDMTLGQKYCLQNSDGTPVKVNIDGEINPNGQYYVFVGKNSDYTNVQQKDHTFRIYHNPACEISSGEGVSANDVLVKLYVDDNKTEDYAGGTLPIEATGKRDFYAKNVYLLTDDQRNNVTEEGKAPESAIKKTNFYLATLDPTDAKTSDIKVTSPFLTSSEYLTQKVYFGYDNEALVEWLAKDENKGKIFDYMSENEKGQFKLQDLFVNEELKDDIKDEVVIKTENLASNTAQFTLQSGWGLLFPGLESGTNYRLVEKIGDDDLGEGYSFKRVEHVEQNGTTVTDVTGKDVDNQKRVYPVTGNTGGKEEAGHFINTWSNLKTETKVNGSEVKPTDENKNSSIYPGVRVGDEITYNIEWYNDAKGEDGTAAKANVQIIDPLDEGVDFVSASDDGQYFKDAAAANAWLRENNLPELSAAGDESKVGNGFVIWNLGEQAANAKGSVTLTVKVNDKAQQFWDYDGDGNGDKPVNPGNPEPDFLVRNRATVRVADHSYNTNTVVNPVGKPSKTETRIERRSTASDADSSPIEVKKPNESDPEKVPDANLLLHEDGKFHGPLVFVGDKITYEIEWQNYRSEPAAITIRDPLDPNVRFVSASFKPADFKDGEGNNLNLADNDKLSVLNEELNQSIAADADGKIEDIATTGTKIKGYGKKGEEERNVIAYSKPDKNKDSSHEVTWNLGVMPSGAHGKVTLVVEVLDSATPVGYVDNTAYVTVNGDPEQQTETIENPTPHQEKTEITPGDGVMVGVGDSITYKIDWHNFESGPANVLIMDTLDPGVDFVSADQGGQYSESGGQISPEDSAGQPIPIPAHTVVWDLGEQPVNASGTVTLTVKVNENAKKTYVYNENADELTQPAESDNADELTSPTENNDYEVLNQARVKVGNNPFTKTEIVDNPVPDKTETEIEHNSYDDVKDKKEIVTEAGNGANLKQQDGGDDANQNQQKDVKWQGPRVYVGDVITYQIHWKNGHNEKADVTITDQLDPGVDFYEAKALASPSNADDVILASSSDAKPNEVQITGGNGDITIDYSKENHTVTWKLKNREPKAEGDVLLKVMVNEKAVPVGYVDNQASVQVGNDPAVDTKIIENPTPHVEKTEISPGEGMQVMPDDEIEYEISWYNYEKEPATVTITDKLDPGVDFLEAAYEHSKLTASEDTKKPETANLTISLAGEEGTDKVFTFTLDLKLPEGKEYPAEGYGWERNQATGNEDVEEQAGTWTNTEGGSKLTLKPGESITVKALPVGTTYTLASEDGKDIVTDVTLGKYGSQIQVTVSNIRISTPSNEIATPPNEKATPSGFSDASRIPTRTPIGYLIDAVKSLLGIETESRIEQTVYEFTAVVVDEPMPIADPEDGDIEELAQDEPIVDPEGDGIDELTQDEQTEDSPTIFSTNDLYGKVIIRYYPKSHKVVWVLENRPANSAGKVQLKVRVNEDAEKFWSYDHLGWGPCDNKKDDRVRNQAGVKVGNHPEVKTRIIENPTKPEKTETQINDKDVSRDLVADENGYVGPNVNVGDTITYQITWQNNAKDESGQLVRAEITITDELDPGVEFVEASDNGSYDPDTHTVTWKLGEKELHERGVVTLKVRVTGKAFANDGKVKNEAAVTVGNTTTKTNRVENPLGELGALTVTKTVTGNLGDQTKDWNFRVELSDNTIEGAFGEMTFEKGMAEFTLKHGESKTASGLPVGITYTVTENEANADGYTTTARGDTGTIQEQDIAEAVFVNHKSDEPDTPPDNPPDTPHGPTPKTPTEPTPENPPVVPPPPEPTQPQPLEEVSFMAPTTGDTSPIGKWILILVMALAGIGISAHQLFRRKTEDPDE